MAVRLSSKRFSLCRKAHEMFACNSPEATSIDRFETRLDKSMRVKDPHFNFLMRPSRERLFDVQYEAKKSVVPLGAVSI